MEMDNNDKDLSDIIESNYIIEYIFGGKNKSITLDTFSKKIASELYKYEKHMRSKLDKFRVEHYGENSDIICLKVNNISSSIRANNDILNNMLHCSELLLIDKVDNTYRPICYVPKNVPTNNDRYFSTPNRLITTELSEELTNSFDIDNVDIVVNKTYIGSELVLFNHNNKWLFCKNGTCYECTTKNNIILCDSIDFDRLNSDMCYIINFVDNRFRLRIEPSSSVRFIVLQSVTEKYSLCTMDKTEYSHDVFKIEPRIYLSCYDHMCVYLDKLNRINLQSNNIVYKGLIISIHDKRADNSKVLTLEYMTDIYNRLNDMLPNNMTKYEGYLHLYQNDKLNALIKYQNCTKMTSIINKAMVTIGRELLDMYFMTRRNNNEWLTNMLGPTYTKILNSLHGCYIKRKNNGKNKTSDCNITSEDVYLKLKNIDTEILVTVFKERYNLNIAIKKYYNEQYGHHNINKILKNCTYTDMFTELLLFFKY
jgi:hypothetical protein